MRKTGTVRRVATRTKVEPLSAGSTVGKMRLYRTTVKDEVCDFMAVIGAGRWDSPKRINRVYRIHL